jgi:putative transcriptional regulator
MECKMAKRVHRKKSSPGTYKSAAFAAVHENMTDLYEAGAIDAKTMRTFDARCLTPVTNVTPAAIRRLRKKEALSQAVLAAHLNVTTGIVSKWERGEKKPRGSAAKLLTLAAKNGIASIA